MNSRPTQGWIARLVLAVTLVVFIGDAASQTSQVGAPVASPAATTTLPPPANPPVAVVSAAQPTPAVDPHRTTLSLDNDLISFVKGLAWVVVVTLGIFAAIALSFFGVDVRAVRKSVLEAQDELRKKVDEARAHEKSLGELKDRLEKLGAELVEAVEKAKTAAVTQPVEPDTKPKSSEEGVPVHGPLSEVWFTEEKKKELLRNLIAASEFEWSTLGTLAKKTGFTRAEVMTLANNDPLVQRGIGRNNDVLFRLKEFNFPTGGGEVKTWDEWTKIVKQHAQQGKAPLINGIFPG